VKVARDDRCVDLFLEVSDLLLGRSGWRIVEGHVHIPVVGRGRLLQIAPRLVSSWG
jgi:hypothetical protein